MYQRRNPLKCRYLLSSHTASHTRRYFPLSELRPVIFHMCLPAFIQNKIVKCSKPSTVVTQKLFSIEEHTPSDMQCDQIMKKNVSRDGADRKLPQSRSITNWSGGPMSFYFLRVLWKSSLFARDYQTAVRERLQQCNFKFSLLAILMD